MGKPKGFKLGTAKRRNGYNGVRAASKYLQEQGVPRVYRKQILESFEVGTISLRTADNAAFGLRFYGGAIKVEDFYFQRLQTILIGPV